MPLQDADHQTGHGRRELLRLRRGLAVFVRSPNAFAALYSTAIHEAAHCVLAALAGMPVHAVLIRENEDGSADGWSEIDSASASPRDQLVVYLAGEAGEAFFVGHLKRASDDAASDSDSARIKELVGRLGEDQLHGAYGRACRLVQQYRADILRLSHAIARHEMVDGRILFQGDELAALLPRKALSAVPGRISA
jgi:hypothetical protein